MRQCDTICGIGPTEKAKRGVALYRKDPHVVNLSVEPLPRCLLRCSTPARCTYFVCSVELKSVFCVDNSVVGGAVVYILNIAVFI